MSGSAPTRLRRSGDFDQAGFALAASIFVLVVLSTLSVYLVTLSGVQNETVRLSVQGERAHFAARSGMEWPIADIINSSASGLSCGAGPVVFALTEGALDGFSVSVDCTATAVTEGASSYTLYALNATATTGTVGTPSYASRDLIATVAF